MCPTGHFLDWYVSGGSQKKAPSLYEMASDVCFSRDCVVWNMGCGGSARSDVRLGDLLGVGRDHGCRFRGRMSCIVGVAVDVFGFPWGGSLLECKISFFAMHFLV